MKECPTCGSQNNDSAKFCYQCGASLSDLNLRCPQCNSVVKQNSKFCPKCGYRFVETGDYETQSIDVIHGYDENHVDNHPTNYQQPPYQGGYPTNYQQPPYQGGYPTNYQQPPYPNRGTQTNFNMNGYPGYQNPYGYHQYDAKKQKTHKVVKEVEDDFDNEKSKVTKEEMEKHESTFNLVISIVSFFALLIGFVFLCIQFVTVNGEENSIWYVLFEQWANVGELYTGLSSANALVTYLYPIFSFVSALGLVIVDITFVLYTLIKGLLNISRKKYKNRFALLVLIHLLLTLITIDLYAIGNQPIGLTPLMIISIVLSFITVLGDVGFKIAKSVISGNHMLLIRKILYTLSFLFSVVGLFVSIFPSIGILDATSSLQKFILEVVSYADKNSGADSPYIFGLVGSILTILLLVGLVLSSIFNYLAITKFNHSKVKVVVFNSISFVFSIVSFVMILLAVTNSSVSASYSTTYAIITIALSGISFVLGLASLIVLKDKEPVQADSVPPLYHE